MPAPAGTSTALRLARIAALVLGCLLFLYACENSKSALLADKWIEVAIAGALLAAGLGAAWFEVKLTDYREYDDEEPQPERAGIRGGPADGRGKTHSRERKSRWIPAVLRADDEPHTGAHEFLVESEGWSMRAKIARSGDLVFHGHDLGGTYPAYEWMWVFHPDTFAEIRAALGDDEGEILELLEEVVPQLDRHGRHDPGAWLRTHDIPATYREKGVSATQETRELPVMQPGLPRPTPRRDEPVSARSHRNELPSNRSRREQRNADLRDEESAPIQTAPARSRRDPVAPSRSRHEDAEPTRSPYDEPEPARARRDPLAPSRSRHQDPEPTRSTHDEPAPARWPVAAQTRWSPEDFGPARSPYEDAAATPTRDQPEPTRAQWQSSARSSYEDFGPTQSPYEPPAQTAWEDEPAPHHEDPAPHWPVRDENTRPPLERRRRSQSAQDDSAPAQSPHEDPADAWARRRRLDAIQAQLEQPSLAAPEQPSRAYRREPAQPQYDSRHGDPDEFLPRQRRGGSAVPHDYAEAGRYEHLSPPRQRSEPSWPERSMPRPRQAPREQPDDYPRSWTDQPAEYDESPPARRRRSTPPPNAAGSGRHATSHSATPPWP
ncbi:hypothetical protein ACIBCN_15495 [Nocardia sp. NPDC051052]|uniref:hypothetical protein n=1 Tax=Nocardia sp. NPDC051052 TaxID=3364322 RepID=UPI003788CC63